MKNFTLMIISIIIIKKYIKLITNKLFNLIKYMILIKILKKMFFFTLEILT